MKNMKTMLCGVVLAAVAAAPALAFPIRTVNQPLQVGAPLNDAGFFTMGGEVLFGLRFTIDVDVTQGSGYGLILDSFGSQAAGSDTELALYSSDGTMILAINDDAGDGSLDAYLGFGDADQFGAPFNGTTRQGNITNVTELLAGTYLVVIGPYNTTWDSFDAQLTEVNNFQGSGNWLCRVLLIPAPGSLALLGLGTLMIGSRRRRV